MGGRRNHRGGMFGGGLPREDVAAVAWRRMCEIFFIIKGQTIKVKYKLQPIVPKPPTLLMRLSTESLAHAWGKIEEKLNP